MKSECNLFIKLTKAYAEQVTRLSNQFSKLLARGAPGREIGGEILSPGRQFRGGARAGGGKRDSPLAPWQRVRRPFYDWSRFLTA